MITTGGPSSVDEPQAPGPNKSIDEGVNKPEDLGKVALRLYDVGFNVIPVEGKKPLPRWSSRERLSRKDLEKLLPRATGIAIAGGPENPFKPVSALALIDIDSPEVLEKSPLLRDIVSKTVSWRTGVRCPHCGWKHVSVLEPGERFRCSRCEVVFTVQEARRGMGALITIDSEVVGKYLGGSKKGKDIEILVNNYQLIPPSLHPTGVRYEWVNPIDFNTPNYGILALEEAEFLELLKELGAFRGGEEKTGEEEAALPRRPGELRPLRDSDIVKIKELLKEAYKPGARQYIWLFLSGWAAKAGISPVAVARILKMLYEEAGDTDPIRTRASSIVYSYRKAGIDLTPYSSEFEELFGVKPYGLEREITEDEIKGKTGLQEILEETLGEEAALGVIKEVEDVFRVSSPFRDSIAEIIDYEKQLYAVANLRKLVVVRARKTENRLEYKEKVFIGAPTQVVVYFNPIGGITKYRVVWEVSTRPRPLVIGPALLEEILDRLRAEGLVVASRLAGDVLAAIINAYQVRGKAEIRQEIEAPGFYLVDGKLIAVGLGVREPGPEELKEALLLLNELADNWFKHIQERFVKEIRKGVVAPFVFAYKQKGKWVKWPYHYGAPKTGKTTLGEIVLAIWGLDSRNVKTGASIDTPARLGYVLSQSTFPVLINEPGGALVKEEIVEMIKASVESTLARGKFARGSYIEIPALAMLIFASNKYLPKDEALIRRLDISRYTYGERIPEERAREFEEKVKPRLVKLKAVGDYVANYFLRNGIGEDLLAQGTTALEEAYKRVGLEPPAWLKLEVREGTEAEVYEDMRELIRGYLVKRINDEYSKFVGRITVEKPGEEGYSIQYINRQEADLETRVRIVLEKQLIPWLLYKKEGRTVYITKGIVRDLEPIIGEIGGLKSLAELLGWVYDKKSLRQGGEVMNNYFIIISLEDLIEFLSPSLEEETLEEAQTPNQEKSSPSPQKPEKEHT
jgi:transposase-like protein